MVYCGFLLGALRGFSRVSVGFLPYCFFELSSEYVEKGGRREREPQPRDRQYKGDNDKEDKHLEKKHKEDSNKRTEDKEDRED